MIPELPVAMLACARLGAAHSVVFGGFSAEALKDRINDAEAKVLITADGGYRRGQVVPLKQSSDDAVKDCPSIEHVVTVRRTGGEHAFTEGRDVWYHDLVEGQSTECPAEPMDAEDLLYILYTSGTTGKPKGIVHTTGGYLTGVAATHAAIFDLHDDDVYWCAADIGWVTGHSYIVYGPLANHATGIIYEGAPDWPAARPVVVDRREVPGDDPVHRAHRDPVVHAVGPRASAGRTTCPRSGCSARWASRSTPRPGSGTGSTSGPSAARSSTRGGRPRPARSSSLRCRGSRPSSRGRPRTRFRGSRPTSTTSRASRCRPAGAAIWCCKRPWPGMFRTIYGDPDRYVETYFARYGHDTYLAGDGAKRDEDGYFWLLGRIDDVMNVAGHRISTYEVESALVDDPKVAEAAVVAKSDPLVGQAIVAFVTLKGDQVGDDAMAEELRDHVSKVIGKIARPHGIIFTADLPKTRSGKIMRRLLRDVAEGRQLGDVTTLANAEIVEQIREMADVAAGDE